MATIIIKATEINIIDLAVFDEVGYQYTRNRKGYGLLIECGAIIYEEKIVHQKPAWNILIEGTTKKVQMPAKTYTTQHILLDSNIEICITTRRASEDIQLEIVRNKKDLQFERAVQHDKKWRDHYEAFAKASNHLTYMSYGEACQEV